MAEVPSPSKPTITVIKIEGARVRNEEFFPEVLRLDSFGWIPCPTPAKLGMPGPLVYRHIAPPIPSDDPWDSDPELAMRYFIDPKTGFVPRAALLGLQGTSLVARRDGKDFTAGEWAAADNYISNQVVSENFARALDPVRFARFYAWEVRQYTREGQDIAYGPIPTS